MITEPRAIANLQYPTRHLIPPRVLARVLLGQVVSISLLRLLLPQGQTEELRAMTALTTVTKLVNPGYLASVQGHQA